MTLPIRKHPRLKNYDYSQCGCYHLTICVKNRRPILSKIIPTDSVSGRPVVQLFAAGRITEHYIQNIPTVYSGVAVDKYVIMPNHVHLLISLSMETDVSVYTIVRSLKRMINRELGENIWQESFYDCVISSEALYRCEWRYIDENPDKWLQDELYL